MQIYNEKHIAAQQRIEELFLKGTPISVAFSGGKDSSVLLDLTFAAAISAKTKGASPYILVTNGDTGIENPEIAAYCKTESQKIIAYARKHGIELSYHVATPNLNETWAVRIIGGRALPSFPQNNSDCSVSWKVKPMASLRKRLMKEITINTGREPVTLVGTRLSESTARATKMTARNETHLAPTRNKDGDLVFAAIADFSTDDVWERIGLVRSKLLDSYSDFNDLTRLYAAAGNTSCAVVSDSITESMKGERGSCNARTGCLVCTKIQNDFSLTNMIESDVERYGYMAAPNKLRDFIVYTQWDFSRRQWVGRSIDENGMIAIRPDVYSPKMCLDLLRYALTIDADERTLAYQSGKSPRFELVPLEALVAIDCMWSLQAIHKPFQAIKEYIDITENRIRYEVPNVPEFPRQPMPKTRYLFLGDYAHNDNLTFSGLRDPLLEMVGEDACRTTRQLKNGKIVLDVETEPSFNVDLEGAVMALDFELDRIMDMHNANNGKTGLTLGYRWWARMGVISLAPQQVSIHDEILRRSELKERIGIAGPDLELDYLFSISKTATPAPKLIEPPKPKAEFKKENQLDFFSMFSLEDEKLAA